MFAIERTRAVFRHLKRRYAAGVLACLPVLVLILSAAPGGCPGPCGEDLVPPTSVVETLP
jgi:hypothetical protein